jgi:fructose-1-phosphate kinase PfkB-like protein
MPERFSELLRTHHGKGYDLPRAKIWLFPTTRPNELLCNCTRVIGSDGRELNTLFAADFTDAEVEGRRQVREYARFFRDHLPGCEASYVNDTGVQVGVRQTRQARGVALLANADALVLSDYGKGGLAHIGTMIDRARAAAKPVLVDPKGDEWDRYRGATVVTPNRSEFRQVAGRARDEADLARRAQALRRELELDALLITRAEEGMSLFSEDGALTIPARAREVFDVSGAGDTVIATLGALLAAGAPLPDAMSIANEAAGVVVGKLGTAVAEPAELG